MKLPISERDCFKRTDVKDAYRVEQALKEKASSQLSEEQLRAMVKDPEVVKRGEAIFATNCVSCHAPDAGGLVGPNLTDDYWIHGGKMTEIVNTITNGVPEKGMISWKNILGPEKIHEVAAFVKSIHGRKTANPKKPEGQLSPD
jgi:cytochrome c oxidase cbb3-type subunit 3